ncbi:MAG: hypothetical protein JEZ11_17725 [Desulfobacterales bacterium]|nr:hypothetical protein [Desulfobacterales bacterium]
MAMNWWTLFYEVEVPRRQISADYRWRHNLRRAREGFAFPNIMIRPMAGFAAIEWEPMDLPSCGVRFLQGGTATLDADSVQQAAAGLVRTVIERLDNEGVVDTPLKHEWDAIEAADKEEAMFCQTAGTLGLDPYSMNDAQSEEIFQVVGMLPVSLTGDFFAIAEVVHLRTQAQDLAQRLQSIVSTTFELGVLRDLKRGFQPIDPFCAPWQEGYRLARQLRQTLGLDGKLAGSLSGFWELLGLPLQILDSAVVTGGAEQPVGGPLQGYFDALLAYNTAGSPGFMIKKQHETSQLFALGRSLFEYLTGTEGEPVLVSSAVTQRQKRNRAFAAEFLAPAELLNKRLPGSVIDVADVQELADHFKVSAYVIAHQLENHNLARVVAF